MSTLSYLQQREQGQLPTPRFFRYHLAASHDLVKRLKQTQELKSHQGCVNTVHFNYAGDLLVSGSDDCQVKFWDWDLGRLRYSYDSGHRNNVFQARTLPHTNDRTIITCAADGQVRCGVISQSQYTTSELKRHDGRAHKMSIEPGSPFCFITAGEDGRVFHFDLRKSKPGTTLIHPRSRRGLYTVNYNPIQTHLFATAGTRSTAQIFDQRQLRFVTDDEEHVVPTTVTSYGAPKLRNTEHITCVTWSWDGTELLCSYNDENIYLFDATMPGMDDNKKPIPETVLQSYKGHRNVDTVKSVNFYGYQSEYVISGSDCGHMFIWDKKTGVIEQVQKGDENVVNCLEPHPFTAAIATSGIDSSIKIWEPTASEPADLSFLDQLVRRNGATRRERQSSPVMLMVLMRILQQRGQRLSEELIHLLGEDNEDEQQEQGGYSPPEPEEEEGEEEEEQS